MCSDLQGKGQKETPFYIGVEKAVASNTSPEGGIVEMDGELWYRIGSHRNMPPFLMSIISASDLWMFISSSGGITAGRVSPDRAIFPYYTDDKIHDSAATTGGRSVIFVNDGEATKRWEPISENDGETDRVHFALYKNMLGSRIIFEADNKDLGLAFRVCWTHSSRFGIIRRAELENRSGRRLTAEILDGIMNILPAGVDRLMQNEFSTLLDGYKKNEVMGSKGLAVYTLSSLLTDKAEPAESLLASVVWSAGVENCDILLSTKQLQTFRRGGQVLPEAYSNGQRGAYLMHTNMALEDGEIRKWYFAADTGLDHRALSELMNILEREESPSKLIEASVDEETERLRTMIGTCDGFQVSRDNINNFRHTSVTLFNILRGGLFENGSRLDRDDFLRHLFRFSRETAARMESGIRQLPEVFSADVLLPGSREADADEERLIYEYLPLSFARRHGDPSRPWNNFAIELTDSEGQKKYSYQGNWRDIFQNWEALGLSFPQYIPHFIVKFLNATTADGYNPYRLTQDGFDWEVPDPDAPWSNIGYWGDHQIVYLHRLLELSRKLDPGDLERFLDRRIFVFADIPYRILPYTDIVMDPRNTIEFDRQKHEVLMARERTMGADGFLLRDGRDRIVRATLAEKLLLTLLVKMSNFIPEAGIWMNTQRPEWNDANNALVGYGVSMVTLSQIRPYAEFLKSLFSAASETNFSVRTAFLKFFNELRTILGTNLTLLEGRISDTDRRSVTDALGQAGSEYRWMFYNGEADHDGNILNRDDILEFLDHVLAYADHSIRSSRREDGLFHSYNIMSYGKDGISIRRLYPMLEGQVAVLASGILSPAEALEILKALEKSDLYRKDQQSYLLYPERTLPAFMEKNRIPEEAARDSRILMELAAADDRSLVLKDASGELRFSAAMKNGAVLEKVLRQKTQENPEWREDDILRVLDIYEEVFDHRSFTGRSGTFYKYEGLGSVYWHMVAKLLLAVQEFIFRASDSGAEPGLIEDLKGFYRKIREGLGSHKSPAEHGAFPTDPYSHTPRNSGAQQPGMTGLTKEEIIARAGELGLRISDGCLSFDPLLFDRNELLTGDTVFRYVDLAGRSTGITVPGGSIALTLCQIPVIVSPSDSDSIHIAFRNGRREVQTGRILSEKLSRTLFMREGSIESLEIRCRIPEN